MTNRFCIDAQPEGDIPVRPLLKKRKASNKVGVINDEEEETNPSQDIRMNFLDQLQQSIYQKQESSSKNNDSSETPENEGEGSNHTESAENEGEGSDSPKSNDASKPADEEIEGNSSSTERDEEDS